MPRKSPTVHPEGGRSRNIEDILTHTVVLIPKYGYVSMYLSLSIYKKFFFLNPLFVCLLVSYNINDVFQFFLYSSVAQQ